MLTGILSSRLNIRTANSIENDWWDAEWMYRIKVNITENSGYSLVNFPVEVTFRHNGHAQLDGKDIRVIDGSMEIPSYVEECNNTYVKVVFEINLTALQTKTVYIYYGNPNAPEPNYPLVPLIISEGQKQGYAIIDNRIYIGWNYTEWGVKSGWYIVGGSLVYIDNNPVVLWTDYRMDFDGDGAFESDEDLITDIQSWKGGIGRYHMEVEKFVERSYGLGDYQGFLQTPIFVELLFADAALRVYRGYNFVETKQADRLRMYGSLWDYAKYSEGLEENIIDKENTSPSLWNILYSSFTNPNWMAYRSSLKGYVFGAIGLNINSSYMYHLAAKESHAWDRHIFFDGGKKSYFDPYDQPPKCKIYWYADNSNGYSEIDKIATILSNSPTISTFDQEIVPEHSLVMILLMLLITALTITSLKRRQEHESPK